MELVKNSVRIARDLGRFVSQVTLEQDMNIPDSKPDVDEIVLQRSSVCPESFKVDQEQAEYSGRLLVELLYRGREGQKQETAVMEFLEMEIPFKERMQMPGTGDQPYVTPVWDVEDLRVRILNSRKLTISGLISVSLETGNMVEEELAETMDEEAAGALEVDHTSKDLDLLELVSRRRDSLRLREEVELGSNKPNIAKLLWKSLRVSGLEYRLEEEKLHLRGELLLFVLYQGEEEHIPPQWLEKSISFSEELDCPQAAPGQIADICLGQPKTEVTVKPDYDGENRVLSLEVLLELSVQLYGERKCTILADAYSPVQELVITRQSVELPRLLAKNNAKCKLTEKLELPEDGGCLQICYSDGRIHLDRVDVEQNLVIEGTVDVELVYMSADDAHPVRSTVQTLPFVKELEVSGLTGEAVIHVRPQVEQLSTVMLSATQVEARLVLALDTFVYECRTEDVICKMQEQPFDEAALEAMPGMIGYVVGEGDTLWSIAKRFYTSIDRLRRYNSLTGDNVRPGDKLLIVKEGQL
jgi:hypothetical protein